MYGNQFHSSGVSKNLNLRIPPDLRARVEAAALKGGKSKADIIRDALELYLPILESERIEAEVAARGAKVGV